MSLYRLVAGLRLRLAREIWAAHGGRLTAPQLEEAVTDGLLDLLRDQIARMPGLGRRVGALYEQLVLGQPLAVVDGEVRAVRSDRNRRPTGVYYTPRAVVRYILNTIPEPPRAVLDLAAGAGAFLLGAQRRWPAAALWGADLDPRAVALCRLAGIPDGPAAPRLLLGDSLRLDWDRLLPGPVDLVIGNPPYYSCQSLPAEAQQHLRQRYPEVWSGQADILYYFIAEGVRRLRPGGRLGFVVARYFLQAAHARRLRGWLLEQCAVEHVLDLQNVQLFPGADVLTVVLVLRREPDPAARAAQQVRVTTVHGWAGPADRLLRHAERYGHPGRRDRWIEVSEQPQAGLGAGPWDLTPPAARQVTVHMARGTVPLGALCRIGQGMKSGANGIFVVSAETAERWGLEPALLRPYVKTRDIRPYRCRWRGLYLLDVRNETPIERYPRALAYLQAHRTVLERRYQFRAGVCAWYALSLPQNAGLFDGAERKLITPAYARESRFALDDGEGYYTLTDTYVLVPEDGVSPEFLAGLLNSRAGTFFYRRQAKLKRDGYYEYVSGPLSRFPVPASPPDALQARVIAAVRALRGGAGGGPCQQELDQAVYGLYGLDRHLAGVIEAQT